MALTDSDRRRFFLATALTLLALPALWWINQSENSTAPNVAVAGAGVGVDVGADHDATAATTETASTESAGTAPAASATTSPTTTTQSDSSGRPAPIFFDGPGVAVGAELSEIAVPAPPDFERITSTATFRSSVQYNVCKIPGLTSGRTVTVVNLETGRSVTCTVSLAPGELADQITLSTSQFAELADLTDAPIPVEIRR